MSKPDRFSRCLVAALGIAGAAVQAAPGDIDPSFGTGGFVFDAMNGNDSRANALVIDASGRILLAGQVAQSGIDNDFGLLRLDSAGNPDATFNGSGRAYASFNASSDEECYGAGVQADGRIIAGGLSFFFVGGTPGNDIVAVRFNVDGSIDTGYGNNGNGWMNSARVGNDFALAMGSGSSGIVLGGYVDDGGGGINAATLLADTLGMPQPLFGSAGVAVAATDTNSARAVASLSSGGVMLGGSLDSGAGGFVLQLDSSGNPDPAFAGDGRAELGALIDTIEDMALMTDGRVLISGLAGSDAAIVRLTAAGSPDASFGTGGRFLLPASSLGAGSLRANALALQTDGRVVGAGVANIAGDQSILVFRVNADGTADAGFGSNGASVFPQAGNQWTAAVALQADGAIVVGGYDIPGGATNDRYFAARIEGGGGGAAPTFSIANSSLIEGDFGSSLMSFTISLSSASPGGISVDVGTDIGTATPNVDYTPTTAVGLTFPTGATSATFQVPVIGDTDVEPDETFLVRLSNPVGATIADGEATGTIIDDDAVGPGPSVQELPGPGALALGVLGLMLLGVGVAASLRGKC